MIQRAFLVFVFLVTVLAAIVARMPLGFVLDQSGVARSGLWWTSVEGTIWQGELKGLGYGAQPIGDLNISARPRALLGGWMRYDLGFTGPIGRGFGILGISPAGVELSQFAGDVQVSELVGLADDIRRIGGTVRLTIDSMRLNNDRCAEARGQISTDALTNAARTYGREVGEMNGTLSCEGGMLVIPMQAQSTVGDEVTARLRVGLVEASTAEARVRTDDFELGNVLVLLGFGVDGADYVYRREAELGGRR